MLTHRELYISSANDQYIILLINNCKNEGKYLPPERWN